MWLKFSFRVKHTISIQTWLKVLLHVCIHFILYDHEKHSLNNSQEKQHAFYDQKIMYKMTTYKPVWHQELRVFFVQKVVIWWIVFKMKCLKLDRVSKNKDANSKFNQALAVEEASICICFWQEATNSSKVHPLFKTFEDCLLLIVRISRKVSSRFGGRRHNASLRLKAENYINLHYACILDVDLSIEEVTET